MSGAIRRHPGLFFKKPIFVYRGRSAAKIRQKLIKLSISADPRKTAKERRSLGPVWTPEGPLMNRKAGKGQEL